MVEAILKGAANAYPGFAMSFGEDALMESPDSIAVIASAMSEIAPSAAGILLGSKEDCY